MADIQLRFHKDMLVLSEPIMTGLEKLGLNVARDGELTLLLEPEVFEEAYKLDMLTGVQCLIAPTATLTPARLTHTNMRERAQELAHTAIRIMQAQKPQHILVEIGPCGLPLDASSKASLNENCDQYKRAALLFENETFDAFFLNGFTRITDLKCALIGMRKVSDAPILASVNIDAQGLLPSGETILDAVTVMAEYGAQTAGFQTGAPISDACRIASSIRQAICLPILTQLYVSHRNEDQTAPTPENPYYDAETMVDAADALRESGVQFLRATGEATPAYTGALVAATDDLDAILLSGTTVTRNAENMPPVEDIATQLREKVAKAINNLT
ncbi:homocysteine S-methyltransferase family protein [Adlercreutzia sp. ZJ304]|uniref:homocysteine S-methyltransferase family protein n=1 Tax=Adlercreutzia sp. ZJ304 TaxID=2709791 RepID=UPI0013EC42D0|nr:homocysteine S-methyltransferase family protein [Adlercreutzia sp. ZJ304]